MIRVRHIIDSHKILTPTVLVISFTLLDKWDSATACIYTTIHGIYGLSWLLKSAVFPDKSWEVPGGIPAFITIYGLLTPYLAIPIWMVSKGYEAPLWALTLAVCLWAAGLVFHFPSDMQKYMSLKLKPGHLITDNYFALSRNPNYFGEVLIYFAFILVDVAALKSYWPFAIFFVHFLFLYSNMVRKDKSLSRYPTFAAYKKRTSFLVPYLW